eukprot:COSAG05_NODE_24815_length_206_cov_8.149533_1_plen_43_part_01
MAAAAAAQWARAAGGRGRGQARYSSPDAPTSPKATAILQALEG